MNCALCLLVCGMVHFDVLTQVPKSLGPALIHWVSMKQVFVSLSILSVQNLENVVFPASFAVPSLSVYLSK